MKKIMTAKVAVFALCGLILFVGTVQAEQTDQSQPDPIDWCFMQCIAQGAGNLASCLHRCMAEANDIKEERGHNGSLVRPATNVLNGAICSISCSGAKPDGTTWTNSCSTSGCTNGCVPSVCTETHCTAGCAP